MEHSGQIDTFSGIGGEAIDLRGFFAVVGGLRYASRSGVDSDDRPDPENPAELLDQHPLDITDVEPYPVRAFVDGTQSAITVTRVEARPVTLVYVSAAAVGPERELLLLREELFCACAQEEAEWLQLADVRIPIEVIDEETPPALERRSIDLVAGKREGAEREVILELVDDPNPDAIIVDGTLVGRAVDPRLIGVVKTTKRRYLADETVIYRLPEGWRSPRFVIENEGITRYSCYVRLFEASAGRRWDFGLIRIESHDPDTLDRAAATAYAWRARPGSDARWDRHLAGMIGCEAHLKARRPAVFNFDLG